MRNRNFCACGYRATRSDTIEFNTTRERKKKIYRVLCAPRGGILLLLFAKTSSRFYACVFGCDFRGEKTPRDSIRFLLFDDLISIFFFFFFKFHGYFVFS